MEQTDIPLRSSKLKWVKQQLQNEYGIPKKRDRNPPLETLIKTVLSQNTTDLNRDRAWESLRKRFSSYEEMDKASSAEIAESIKSGGLQHQKAQTIKRILRTLRKTRGEYSLKYLENCSTEEVLNELESIKGVGRKTAAVVSLFALDKHYFPVDTHVRRVTSRLGLVSSGEDHHKVLNKLIPDKVKYQLHLQLIRHGREICKARTPACDICILLERCLYGQKRSP